MKTESFGSIRHDPAIFMHSRLQADPFLGTAQIINLGADVILADAAGRTWGASATTANAARAGPAGRSAAACASA